VLWHECSKELQRRVDRIQNYGMGLILSKPPRTPSEGLRQKLKWTHLSKRRDIVLVHRCMNNRAPEYLSKEFKELGLRRTRGYDKLHLKSVKTEWEGDLLGSEQRGTGTTFQKR